MDNKHVSPPYGFGNNGMFTNGGNNGDMNRSFTGKDLNSNRKRPFCAPKPDTPPVCDAITELNNLQQMNNHCTPLTSAPYWNNPIWNGENTPPPQSMNVRTR